MPKSKAGSLCWETPMWKRKISVLFRPEAELNSELSLARCPAACISGPLRGSAVINEVSGAALGNHYGEDLDHSRLFDRKVQWHQLGQQLNLEHGEHRNESSIFNIINLGPEALQSPWECLLLMGL